MSYMIDTDEELRAAALLARADEVIEWDTENMARLIKQFNFQPE
jgi:hypothetical protein